VLDLLKEMAEEMEDIDATLDEFGEEIDAISDDLSDVEDAVFEDEDDDDDDDEDYDDEEDFFEMECPNCGEDLVIDDEVLVAGVVDCPNCGQKYALSCDEACGGDCEGCSCECEE